MIDGYREKTAEAERVGDEAPSRARLRTSASRPISIAVHKPPRACMKLETCMISWMRSLAGKVTTVGRYWGTISARLRPTTPAEASISPFTQSL